MKTVTKFLYSQRYRLSVMALYRHDQIVMVVSGQFIVLKNSAILNMILNLFNFYHFFKVFKAV